MQLLKNQAVMVGREGRVSGSVSIELGDYVNVVVRVASSTQRSCEQVDTSPPRLWVAS